MSRLLELLRGSRYPMIGMVQLPPLPGGSTYQGAQLTSIIDVALEEADLLNQAGLDALMIQNLGDIPVTHKVSPTQLTWMTRVASEVVAQCQIPVGLNFMENDAEAAIACASAVDLDFVRIKVFVGVMVTPFGLMNGVAHAVHKVRNLLDAQNVAILADVHDRTGINLGGRDIEEDIREAVDLGGADALVLTAPTYDKSLQYLRAGKKRVPDTPLVLGGGTNESNIGDVLALADGAIVSSSLKDSGNAFGKVDLAKARRFMAEVRAIREKQPLPL